MNLLKSVGIPVPSAKVALQFLHLYRVFKVAASINMCPDAQFGQLCNVADFG